MWILLFFLVFMMGGRLVTILVPESGAVTGGELDGDGCKVHHLQHLLGLGINLDNILFKSRDVWNVVVPSLPLFLLQLDGDSPNGAALKTLHQMGDESSDLVPQRLGGNESNLLDDPLVDIEVKGELGVVLLDDESRSLLNRLGPDTAHFRVSCRSESSNISLV